MLTNESCRALEIRPDNQLTDERVLALLRFHLDTMAPTAPAESRHALDLSGLRRQDITFWCLWDGEALAGFGALKRLSPEHGEIKSMRTAPEYLRRGVAARMLAHIIDAARQQGFGRLSLETGSMAFFKPAHELYASFGFTPCEPFGDYRPDPLSLFMTMSLSSAPHEEAAG